MGYEALSYVANNEPADEFTDSLVHYLKKMQQPEGYWDSGRGSRPPLNSDDFIVTALAAKTIKHYAREVDQADTARRLALTAAWLGKQNPVNTQERAFRLLGLAWSGGDKAAIAQAVKQLAASQRPDGGWSQLTTMRSDSYATGQALYALRQGGGMSANDKVHEKGVAYLLRTQAADGSWHVKTRALPVQPYFESGFPYGHDQWISAAGTSWASMALALAVEPK
jgi:squalene cyclase